MRDTISVIVPNWNGEATIAHCLDAVFASRYDVFEVIVVDDCSTDNSVEIIKQYPCRLIELPHRKGAAVARNTGAAIAQGEIIFFTDADCLILEGSLTQVKNNFDKEGSKLVLGGTYTCMPYDKSFFSVFQSVFVHYSEIKNKENPDYIATHAMAVKRLDFKHSGGFLENFSLPIIEDVEYTHRLQRDGFKLLIDPELQVRHIFGFSFTRSLKNAFKKSKYWTIYSMGNQDLFKNSGCASYELKANTILFAVTLIFLLLYFLHTELFSPLLVICPLVANLIISSCLLKLYYDTGGIILVLEALVYYMLIYSVAVGLGGIAGVCTFFIKQQNRFIFAREQL